MKIQILNVVKQTTARSNKDTNGGFGTVNEFGDAFFPRILTLLKDRVMNFPELLPGYVISILRKQGIDVTYEVNRVDPDAQIILFPTSIINYQSEINFAVGVKRNYPAIQVGFMGGMASANPHLYQDVGDFVITGEIEQLLLEQSLQDVHGVQPAGLVHNLDSLPFPNWSHWCQQERGYRLLRRTSGKSFPIQGSRGCPMPCSFYCTYPLVQGSTFRARSPENILEEIIYLQKEYGMENVLFRDPIFSLKMERIERLCQLIIAKNVRFKWICETHPKFLNPALIMLMAKAGCTAIKLGIESRNLEVMKKSHRTPDNIHHQEEIIRGCEENGIDVLGFYILGYFDDTEETVQDTINYACELNTFGAQFTVATPYPGTPWHQSLDASREIYMLDTDLERYNQYNLVYQHPNLSAKQLAGLKNQSYQAYYLRWSYFRKHFLHF